MARGGKGFQNATGGGGSDSTRLTFDATKPGKTVKPCLKRTGPQQLTEQQLTDNHRVKEGQPLTGGIVTGVMCKRRGNDDLCGDLPAPDDHAKTNVQGDRVVKIAKKTRDRAERGRGRLYEAAMAGVSPCSTSQHGILCEGN